MERPSNEHRKPNKPNGQQPTERPNASLKMMEHSNAPCFTHDSTPWPGSLHQSAHSTARA
eukprot:11190554-Lingulodinium_polyedra.AAC.1